MFSDQKELEGAMAEKTISTMSAYSLSCRWWWRILTSIYNWQTNAPFPFVCLCEKSACTSDTSRHLKPERKMHTRLCSPFLILHHSLTRLQLISKNSVIIRHVLHFSCTCHSITAPSSSPDLQKRDTNERQARCSQLLAKTSGARVKSINRIAR
jgi:hypothetical protein